MRSLMTNLASLSPPLERLPLFVWSRATNTGSTGWNNATSPALGLVIISDAAPAPANWINSQVLEGVRGGGGGTLSRTFSPTSLIYLRSDSHPPRCLVWPSMHYTCWFGGGSCSALGRIIYCQPGDAKGPMEYAEKSFVWIYSVCDRAMELCTSGWRLF